MLLARSGSLGWAPASREGRQGVTLRAFGDVGINEVYRDHIGLHSRYIQVEDSWLEVLGCITKRTENPMEKTMRHDMEAEFRVWRFTL